MKTILILCEGKADLYFIREILKILFGFDTQIKHGSVEVKGEISINNILYKIRITPIGGCDKIRNKMYIDELQLNASNQGINIIIFDADFTNKSGNNGVENTRRKLNDLNAEYNTNCSFYLWPDNESDGIFENLLMNLIPESKSAIIKCISNTANCLNELNFQGIHVPTTKELINYYTYICTNSSKIEDRKYSESEFWDLSDIQNSPLQNFYSFLSRTLGE